MTIGAKGKPAWLEPMWERKRNETADRVRAAVAKLSESRQPVTVASICATVRSLYGVSISSNTIKRNHLAYEIYKHHCGTRASSALPEAILKRISDRVPEGGRRSFWSKVARLRREPKDRLIARLIEAEEALQKDKTMANALREEVFQLSLREMTRGGSSSGTEPKA
jgi:hypothetical protein